jgi:methionine sulfoxide reductase heme-binding subunit
MKTKLILFAILALVAEAIAVRLGWFADPIPKLAGTAAWTTSRAAGVTAFGALTLDVVFGLFVSTGAIDRWVPRGASVDVHRWLSSVALTFVGVHALALLGDAWITYDAIDLVVPWSTSYRPGAVAIGIFALYAMVVIHRSFDWRKRIGVRVWRAIHFLAFAVFVAAVAHGLAAGTDAEHQGLRALYIGASASVLALIVLRVVISWAARVRARARLCAARSPAHRP